MTSKITLVELTEYVAQYLSNEDFSLEEAKLIWRDFSPQLHIEEPGYFNGMRWSVMSRGWVGYIPLTPTLHFSLQPKAPLHNLFRMLDLVYFKGAIQFLKGPFDSSSLVEFYDELAGLLAKRILDRLRQGIYRAYEAYADELLYVRGRLDANRIMRQPWRVGLPCDFEDHTADIEENQILGLDA